MGFSKHMENIINVTRTCKISRLQSYPEKTLTMSVNLAEYLNDTASNCSIKKNREKTRF